MCNFKWCRVSSSIWIVPPLQSHPHYAKPHDFPVLVYSTFSMVLKERFPFETLSKLFCPTLILLRSRTRVPWHSCRLEMLACILLEVMWSVIKQSWCLLSWHFNVFAHSCRFWKCIIFFYSRIFGEVPLYSTLLWEDVVHLIHMFQEYGFMALIGNANFVPWTDD